MQSFVPYYVFVYGTLKQGEANFDRWMAPFLRGSDSKANAVCSCHLCFAGPAKTVSRLPFFVYDYPCVLNAPYNAPTSDLTGTEEGLYLEPQQVVGEAYELVLCEEHGNDPSASPVVVKLDILEDLKSGLYSRESVAIELSKAQGGAPEVAASQIYFRTDCYPRNLIVSMLTAGNNKAAEIPQLLSPTSSNACVAAGRVENPVVKGFIRSFHGKLHAPIIGE